MLADALGQIYFMILNPGKSNFDMLSDTQKLNKEEQEFGLHPNNPMKQKNSCYY